MSVKPNQNGFIILGILNASWYWSSSGRFAENYANKRTYPSEEYTQGPAQGSKYVSYDKYYEKCRKMCVENK